MGDNNNVLGPGSIFQELPKGQKCDYEQKFSFNEKALQAFIAQCNQTETKQKLSQNEFLQQCLSPDDFQKLSSSDLVDQDLAAKIFIAINNSAGHVTDAGRGHHIGQKPFDIGGEDFAQAFFNLVSVSTERTLYLEETEIATHRNIDGNICKDNRNNFNASLTEREAVVKVQLQAAIDLLGEQDSEVKKKIQDFLQKLDSGYPYNPTDDDKKQAQEACDLANLVRAINIAKKDEIAVFQRPYLFNVIQEEPEIFSQRVQEVVNAINKPIIVEKELYQSGKGKVALGNFNGRMCDITKSNDIKILQEAAQVEISGIKLVLSINGATHQMATGRIKDWTTSAGKNFKTSQAKPKLPLEEEVRKAQQTQVYQAGKSVAVSYSIDGEQSIAIGKVSIVDRSIQILEAKIAEVPAEATASTEAAAPTPAQAEAPAEAPALVSLDPDLDSSPATTCCCCGGWLFEIIQNKNLCGFNSR